MATILAPNKAHNGITAGVRFTAGVGHTDRPAALAYFARAGYTIESEGMRPTLVPTAPPAAVKPVEAVPTDPANPFAPSSAPVAKPLERMNKTELAAIAIELGADPEGTNRELVARIRAARGE